MKMEDILIYSGPNKGLDKMNWENQIARLMETEGKNYIQYRDANNGHLYEMQISSSGKSITPFGNPYWVGGPR
jgi:hypothetical protein